MIDALMRVHQWLALPRFDLDEELFEIYAVVNWSMALGLVTHFSWIFLFAALGVPSLALLNVVSVVCFTSTHSSWHLSMLTPNGLGVAGIRSMPDRARFDIFK